jgi:hypothetical protein
MVYCFSDIPAVVNIALMLSTAISVPPNIALSTSPSSAFTLTPDSEVLLTHASYSVSHSSFSFLGADASKIGSFFSTMKSLNVSFGRIKKSNV